ANRRAAAVVLAAAVALASTALGAGCSPSPTPRPSFAAPVVVRGFTEATSVKELHASPPYLLAVTDAGLDRWDLRGGEALRAGLADGMPDGEILAHDLDRGRRVLWLATESSVARYDVDLARAEVMARADEFLGVGSLTGAILAAAADGGVWIGLPGGLYHVSEQGWRTTAIDEPVHAVLDLAGELWIGTEAGLFVVDEAGDPVRLGPEA